MFQAPIPSEVFFKPWKNEKGWLSLIELLAAPIYAQHSDVVSIIKSCTRRITLDLVPLKNVNIHDPLFQPWACIGLLESLLSLSEVPGLMDRVQTLLTTPVSRCPEILAFTLVKSDPSRGQMLYKLVLDALTKVFLEQSPNASVVLSQFFQAHPAAVLQSMAEYVGNDRATRLSRVLDVAQDIKALSHFLQTPNHRLAIEGAVMASQRDFVNLNVWLQTRMQTPLPAFILACLGFLQDRMFAPQASISLQVQDLFLNHLQALAASLPAEVVAILNKLVEKHISMVSNTSLPPNVVRPPAISHGVAPPDMQQGAPAPRKEVKDAANAFFEQIFSEKISIDQCIALFQTLQTSTNPLDHEVFDCMITNLFGEYRFLAQYPEKELMITANLVGVLVLHNLLVNQRLLELMQMVLEAISKDQGSNVYRFGLIALSRFKERLREWPNYATRICQSPNFNSFPDELKALCMISKTPIVATARTGPSEIPQPFTAPVISEKTPSLVPAPNSKDLAQAAATDDYPRPPNAAQEQVSFVINNLSDSNIKDKAREIKSILQPQYIEWFAHYVVVNRALQEPNFQPLYAQFLDALEDTEAVQTAVLNETYKNVHFLLRRHFISGTSTQTDRNLFKHLAHWLGLQTLARNRPILYKDLAVKELLVQAYELGPNHLLIVVPFVTRVLETGKSGRVFKPPNPWVMSILRVLRELHMMPGMKLNLKFEVEVLCKAFNVKIEDILPTEVLKEIIPGVASQQSVSTAPEAVEDKPLQVAEPAALSLRSMRVLFPGLSASLSSLTPFIQVDPNLQLFQVNPTLKQFVQPCIEKAIAEANFLAVRAAKLASQASFRIVGKDFATDPEESHLRFAAQQTAQILAASYALMISRDHLKNSLTQILGTAFIQHIRTAVDVKTISPFAEIVCNQNLDLVCAFMANFSIERASVELETLLTEEYNDRRLHRELRSQQPFVSKLFKASPVVPLALLPKLGGPDPQQFSVYDRFFSSHMNVAAAPAVSSAPPGTAAAVDSAQQLLPVSASPADFIASKPAVLENSPDKCLLELERSIVRTGQVEFSLLPAQHEIFPLMREVLSLIAQNPNRTELACLVAKKLFFAVVEADETRIGAKLLKDVFFVLLVQLQDAYRIIYQDLTREYAQMASPRRFDAELVVRMLRARLLEASDLDLLFVKLLESAMMTQFIPFVEDVLRGCLLPPDRPLYLGLIEFANSIDALRKIAQVAKPPRESLYVFIDALNAMYQAALKDSLLARNPAIRDEPGDPPALREIVAYYFEEWIRISNVTPRSEGAVTAFINKLMAQGLLKSEDISSRFFRVSTDFAVQLSPSTSTATDTQSSNVSTSYVGVDAYARLIIALLKHLKLTVKIVLVLNKVLATLQAAVLRDHEQHGTNFNQKPYHRLFLNLLSEVQSTVTAADENTTSQLLGLFAQVFHNLRPMVLPGFCFAWLSLISHRNFMPVLLQFKSSKGPAQVFQHLLVSLFNFMGTHLQSVQLTDAMLTLYKGTLRVLLVLLHDFPEFLSEFYFSLCDAIPSTCVQLRNLILSAYPRTTQLPNPLTSSLKVDTLPEINIAPVILSTYLDALQSSNMLNDLVSFMSGKSSPMFLHTLPLALLNTALSTETQSTPTSKYNVRLINSLVLHVGVLTIERFASVAENAAAEGPAVELFSHLTDQLDAEGKYHLFNAIANQLRYPNSHTKYFSHVILALFLDAVSDSVREQIVRVLLERLIAFRPQPWGLLVTTIELIKNPTYKFWSYEFVHRGMFSFQR